MHQDSIVPAASPAPSPVFDLARQLHHTVAQRLAGLSFLLASGAQQPEAALARCRSEVDAALVELREALTGLDSSSVDRGAERIAVDTEAAALLEAFPGVDLRWRWDESVAIERGGLVEDFLVEALRNVRKHSQPSQVDVEVRAGDHVRVIEVVNDGVGAPRASSCGAGRHLLELEACLQGALVESEPRGRRHWVQRIILP